MAALYGYNCNLIQTLYVIETVPPPPRNLNFDDFNVHITPLSNIVMNYKNVLYIFIYINVFAQNAFIH